MVDLVRKNANANGNGELTDEAQTIAGDKTFSGNTTFSGTGVFGGNVTASNLALAGTVTTTSVNGNGTGTVTAHYARNGSMVVVSIKFSVAKTVSDGIPWVALLPAGFRPARRHFVTVGSSIGGVFANNFLRVDADGAVNFYTNAGGNILNGQSVVSAGSGSDYASFSFQADAT